MAGGGADEGDERHQGGELLRVVVFGGIRHASSVTPPAASARAGALASGAAGHDLLHSSVTARSPARHGSIPAQPSNGGRPVSPEVSLTSRSITAMPVPSTNTVAATPRAHRLPALTAQIVPDPADDAERSEDGQVDQVGGDGRVDARLGVGGIAGPDVAGQYVAGGMVDVRDDHRDDGEPKARVHRPDGRSLMMCRSHQTALLPSQAHLPSAAGGPRWPRPRTRAASHAEDGMRAARGRSSPESGHARWNLRRRGGTKVPRARDARGARRRGP